MTLTTNPPAGDKVQAFLTDLIDNPPRAQLGLAPGDLVGVVKAARNALEQGDVEAGLSQFAKLVFLDATAIDHHIGLAEAALAAELNELALTSACTVMVLDPRRADGYLLSGRAALAMGEIDAAVEDLTDAVKLADGPQRDFAQSWLVRAQATDAAT
jgi:tetratricopeptide (TPR) repeat protein